MPEREERERELILFAVYGAGAYHYFAGQA